VSDDGTGIDFRSVRRRAERLGIPLPRRDGGVPDEETLTDLLFAPGFSTRDNVSEISGRGVGLDAVRVAAARLGGSGRIRGPPGPGTALRVSVPGRRSPLDLLLLHPLESPIPFALDAAWEVDASAPASGRTSRAPSLDMVSVAALPRCPPASPASTHVV